jgi:hypothetical protein
MKVSEADEIVDMLPKGKTKFYYFKDKYALDLLGLAVNDSVSVHELKKSAFSRLLQRPLVKSLMAAKAKSHLDKSDFVSVWPKHPECYLLTLGTWGHRTKRWHRHLQLSRPGANLVLQLNFSSAHDRRYRRLLGAALESDERPFDVSRHPTARKPYNTLAWSRIDFDLDGGEALIEELQSDWIRLALRRQTIVEQIMTGDAMTVAQYKYEAKEKDPEALRKYVNEVLLPHVKLWDEAMLSASIAFIREELGLRRIFLHTLDGGKKLKYFGRFSPPRSLYETLPRKFCFARTDRRPVFLSEQIQKLDAAVEFHCLDL